MNTRSAHVCITFAPSQLLRNWCKQRPSKYNGLDWNVTRQARVSITQGVHVSDSSFASYYVIVVELRFKWHELYNGRTLRHTTPCQ
jgi:hypothetical protein